MPVTGEMPYQWYDTPNIHLCTINDFRSLATSLNLSVTHLAAFNFSKEIKFLRGWRSTLAVYRFESPNKA
jgi:methionine biosynthesis protein MetW